MKRTGWFTVPAVALAMTGLALPQLRGAELAPRPAGPDPWPARAAQAAAPEVPTPPPAGNSAAQVISDVALDATGMLRGQVVDPQGTPLAGVNVVLAQQDRVVCTALTNREGLFAVSGLAGGVYQLNGANGEAIYRVWAPRTAPPAAQAGALLVSGQQLVRAQGPSNNLRRFFTSPWVLAGMLGAAIIVPIALNNREKIATS